MLEQPDTCIQLRPLERNYNDSNGKCNLPIWFKTN